MVQKSATTSLSPKVVIQDIYGNLQVKGWDQSEVWLRSSDDRSTLEAQDDSVNISSHGDCVIRLPHDADLQILSVHGNTRIKLLEGQLRLDRVIGSLELRNVESVQAGAIEGNLLAKQVAQDLVVDQVQGNAIARDVQGKCILKQVGGNLDLRDTEDDIEAAVGGNARLRLCMLVGLDYRIKAGGNLQCEVPEDASLVAELHSGAQRIKVQRLEGKSTLAEAYHSLTLGDGKATMALKAGGAISFAAQVVDWEEMDESQDEMDETFSEFPGEFGQQIADQVEAQIEAQMEILNQNLAKLETMIGKSGMPPEEADQVMQRARLATEKANLRAQERMRRAQEKLERKLQAAQRKSEMKMKTAERHERTPRRHSWGIQWSTPPSPTNAAPADEVTTDEERLLILRMLEEKKITLQEAEELLAALEGK
jgi:hypothetical protein